MYLDAIMALASAPFIQFLIVLALGASFAAHCADKAANKDD